MKKKIILLLGIILFVQLFAVVQMGICPGFDDKVHYSAFDLELRIIEGIHGDKNIPLWMVRMFHNKLVGSGFDLVGAYLQFWKIGSLTQIISLAGVVGVAAGFYAFFSSKKKSLVLWLLLGYLLLAPLVEIFGFTKLPYLFRLSFIALPFLAWSLFGYWSLLQTKKLNLWLLIALLVVSVWYQTATAYFLRYCY